MKKVILTLMLVAISVTACGKKDQKLLATRQHPNARGGGSSIATPLTGTLFLPDPMVFQEAIRGLVNASIPEESLGYVGNGNNDETGVAFGGRVQLGSGGFNPNGNANGTVSSNSAVVIQVWDDAAVQGSAPPVEIKMSSQNAQMSGGVSGNYAEIQFQDAFGTLIFAGNFDSAYFQGELYYNNEYNYNKSSYGGEGTVQFRIRTCDFFVCR